MSRRRRGEGGRDGLDRLAYRGLMTRAESRVGTRTWPMPGERVEADRGLREWRVIDWQAAVVPGAVQRAKKESRW